MYREKIAKEAINQFVQNPCAFIFPGKENEVAPEVGTGTILKISGNKIAILTAKHVAESAIKEPYRLGYYKSKQPINNFVEGILLHPDDIDVALLIVKDTFSSVLKKYAISINSVGDHYHEINDNSHLLLCGFPAETVQTNLKAQFQGFVSLTYWSDFPLKEKDKKDRIRLEWGNALHSGKEIDLPSPKGISGGPLWCFQRPDSNSIWDPGSIGKIIGLQSEWDRKNTVIIEPIKKWHDWFKNSILKIEEM